MPGANKKKRRDKHRRKPTKERGIWMYCKDGKDYFEVDIRLELPDGRRSRKRVRNIPQLAIAKKLRDKLKVDAFEGRHLAKPAAAALTVRKAWENYKPVSKRKNKPRSYSKNCSMAKHLLEHLGSHKADFLTQGTIDAYRTKREAEVTWKKTPPKAGTINREVALLKRILNYALKRGDLIRNPLSGVEMPDEDNIRKVVITEDDFAELYAHAEAPLKPILRVAFDTGMRRGEILELQWKQVSLKDRTIRLDADDTKSKQPRLIIMTDAVHEELSNLPRSIGGYVFASTRTGNRWYDLKKIWDRARTAANLEHVWFHDLRRGFVTRARKRGIPESVVMKMSGHRTRTVFERYNIVDEDDLRDAVKRLEEEQSQQVADAENQ